MTDRTHVPAQAVDASTALSFDDWVAARGPALLRFAHLVTGNLSDAQDAVQDALVAVYPGWQRLQAAGTEEAYVRRAIVNRNISVWRSLRRRESPTADIATVAAASAPSGTLGAVNDPAALLADADLAWQLCATLPRLQRAAVVLRYYEDQSFAEIARILECPESTARSHVHRALAVLRTRLQEGDEADE